MSAISASESIDDTYLGLKLPSGIGVDRHLMTGAEFLSTMNDGRRALDSDGRFIEDVTKHPATAAGIQTLATYYDMQHQPEHRDLMTYDSPEVGGRASLAWKTPRSKADLQQRRKLTELSSRLTLGTFGRPPDYGPLQSAGLLQIIDRIEDQNQEWADNARAFALDGLRLNLMSTDLLADVQSDRNIPTSQKPGRLRCVSEDESGMVVYGAKPCNSIAVQGHVGAILTLLSPGIDMEAAIFAVVPVNAEGITFVLRESAVRAGDPYERPISQQVGDEVDALMIFENVFIPRSSIFSIRNERVLDTYYERGALPQWHILSRMAYRAGILAGTADMVTQVLGTDRIPQVRDAVAEIASYSQCLRAFVMAAEEAGHLQNDVYVPSQAYITPGRLYGIENYPRIIQILRELCGQGLISRFTQKQFTHEQIGQYLDEFLPGTGVTASDKNRLFNFVWELTCSEQAMRIGLFENLNATPPGAMRAFIYRDDRSQWQGVVRDFIEQERA